MDNQFLEKVSEKLTYLKPHLLDPHRWDELITKLTDIPFTIRYEADNKLRIHDKITKELRKEVTKIHRALKEIKKLDTDLASGLWQHWPDYGKHDDPLAAHNALIDDCDSFLRTDHIREYSKKTGRMIVSMLDTIRQEYTDIELSSARRVRNENLYLRLVQDVGEFCFPGEDLKETSRGWILEYMKEID